MSRKNLFLIIIVVVAALVNLLGAFGPELGFDALWYHLPIAKIYLHARGVFHIPGGLLYYSAMPRLAEIMFIPLIKLFGDTGPHLLNWSAGVGTAVLIYKISRKYLDQLFSLLAVIIWYVTPLVGWQSGSGYIDLIRTFWETLAILLILNKRYVFSGLVFGLAISTKTLSLGTIPILTFIVWLDSKKIRKVILFVICSLFVSLPWYLLSFLNTGFPFFPIGSATLGIKFFTIPQILNPLAYMGDYWKVFMVPEDLISPIFVIIIPFAIFKFRTLISKFPLLIAYFLLSYSVWYLIPRTGGGRFLLPYLPIWSVLTAVVISLQSDFIKKVLIFSVLCISLFNLVYRLGAERKILNYISGKETKSQYLCRNLNFNFGDFYDCDGFFAKNIKPTNLVLVKGVHNLYYMDFPFIHETWYRGEKVNYTLVQGKKHKNEATGKLVYQNNRTNVRLYKVF